MHAEVQLDDEVRGYVDMVATIFVSICGGRKERPCSLPRSDSNAPDEIAKMAKRLAHSMAVV
jgi:hypothetical protein